MKICEKSQARIMEIIDEYRNENTPLMIILEEIQKEFGYVPLEVQEIVSKELNIPVATIYGVVTFYSYFSLNPKGKYVLGICLGTACYVKGARQNLDKLIELLGIQAGQTTEDGLFTLSALRCLGACSLAPAISINGKVYSKVTVSKIPEIIEKYRILGGEETHD